MGGEEMGDIKVWCLWARWAGWGLGVKTKDLQSSFDNAGLAVLRDLMLGLKVEGGDRWGDEMGRLGLGGITRSFDDAGLALLMIRVQSLKQEGVMGGVFRWVGCGLGGGGFGGVADLQSSFDDAGLAVLDDLVQSLKVLVPQGENHPARVVVFPPQTHRLLTAGLHLRTPQKGRSWQAHPSSRQHTCILPA